MELTNQITSLDSFMNPYFCVGSSKPLTGRFLKRGRPVLLSMLSGFDLRVPSDLPMSVNHAEANQSETFDCVTRVNNPPVLAGAPCRAFDGDIVIGRGETSLRSCGERV